jgi:hypothetical protein
MIAPLKADKITHHFFEMLLAEQGVVEFDCGNLSSDVSHGFDYV